jgi:flagellar biosynthesis/type III secretory pathway M-ring protein FliF/YscJ
LREGPPPKTTASVLLEHRGTTPPLTADAIQRLVAGGAPALLPADVAVVFLPHAARPAPGRSELAHVGPIVVARTSSNTLKIALASLVLVMVGFATLSLVLYAKLARSRREREEEAAQAARGMAPRNPPGSPPGPMGPVGIR